MASEAFDSKFQIRSLKQLLKITADDGRVFLLASFSC